MLAGYLGSIDEYAKSYNLKQADKTSQTEEDETVSLFTQNLVSGELTEQLMRLLFFFWVFN